MLVICLSVCLSVDRCADWLIERGVTALSVDTTSSSTLFGLKLSLTSKQKLHQSLHLGIQTSFMRSVADGLIHSQ